MTDPRADSPPSTDAPVAPPHVLVVDDDTASRRLVVRALNAIGYTAEDVGDGARALEMICARPPALILLDLDMPGLSGMEVCARLRHHQRKELRHIPTIMLTAHDSEAQEVACLDAGANDFITKPIGRAALAARIATQLRLRSLNEALRLQKEELERWQAAQIADLEAAQQVQRALLPTLEEVPGWKLEVAYTPIIQVGGDMYGLEAGRDGYIVWLADATGHGVAAALYTALVARLFHRAAASTDLARMLADVNAGMLRIFHKRSVMSAACLQLTPDGTLCFAGAGHPPLLIRRADGRVETCESQGTVLGVLAECAFSTNTVQLAPGESALLLSDGLYSARRPDGERCDLNDLQAAFADGGSLPALIEQMRGESAFDDDLTAILMTRA